MIKSHVLYRLSYALTLCSSLILPEYCSRPRSSPRCVGGRPLRVNSARGCQPAAGPVRIALVTKAVSWPFSSYPKPAIHARIVRPVAVDAEQTTELDVFERKNSNRKSPMPYTRPIRRFYLTPPAVPTFVISVLLAVVALLAVYGNVPQLHSIGGFTILLIAYVILLLGTLLRGV